jgi:hypothetical protein
MSSTPCQLTLHQSAHAILTPENLQEARRETSMRASTNARSASCGRSCPASGT